MDTTSILKAARTHIARVTRTEHPQGSWDKAKRWWPDDTERRHCCSRIRGPSRAWPYTYMKHCRSLQHVAALYGVNETLVRRALQLIKEEHDEAIIHDTLVTTAAAIRFTDTPLSTKQTRRIINNVRKTLEATT